MKKDNKQDSTLFGFLVDSHQKRRKSIKIITQKQKIHHKTIYHSNTNINKNIQSQKSLTKPHAQNFRNKLLLYLHQNEIHSKNITQQIEKKGLNQSCEWLKIKKQHNQGNLLSKEKNFQKKKNIKQYISQISLQKKKKYSIKYSVYNTVQSDHSEEKQINKHTSMLIIQNIDKNLGKKTNQKRKVEDRSIFISKLIPIHHTQVYFFQKQHKKNSNHPQYQTDNDRSMPEPFTTNNFNYFNKNQQDIINQSKIQQNEIRQEEQQFKHQPYFRKHGQYQRLRLSEGNQAVNPSTPKQDNNTSRQKKRGIEWRKLKKPKKRQSVKQEKEQNAQLGPWKRRNTIESQTSL